MKLCGESIKLSIEDSCTKTSVELLDEPNCHRVIETFTQMLLTQTYQPKSIIDSYTEIINKLKNDKNMCI